MDRDWTSDAGLFGQLVQHEGERRFPYIDTVGKVSIGIGRNLTDVGISADEESLMYANDLRRAVGDLDRRIPWWRTLDDIRQRVLIDMCFNMGWAGLSMFKNMLLAVRSGHFDDAALAMRSSKWSSQVGHRADRLIEMMRTGEA